MESLSDPVAPVEAIIKRCESSYLMRHYIVPEYSSTDEFLSNVAKRFGRLRKGKLVFYKFYLKFQCVSNYICRS